MENNADQPTGRALDWTPATPPPRVVLQGQYCAVVTQEQQHAPAFFAATQLDPEGRNWTYLFEGPFTDPERFKAGWTRAILMNPAFRRKSWHITANKIDKSSFIRQLYDYG